MNLSQFCNISLFSKPAARHTNKDRLLYSTTSTSGGRFAARASAGFTLVEVLVAMVILLVGIWTLAMGFPKLLGVIATEEKRTEMARQAERTLNQLTRYSLDLPLAISGDRRLPDANDPTGRYPEDIPATGSPDDPSITDFAITHANARDDMIEVIGERFTVPAPTAPPYGPYPVHVFRQGLAASVQAVYQEIPLPDSFSVDPDGTVNPGSDLLVEINYDWVESGAGGTTHHVYGEFIDTSVTSKVAAAALTDTFGQVLSGTVDGIRLFALTAPPPDTPPASRQVSADPSGAFLLFNESAVGARMRVNYTLLTEPARHDRRALIMSEEHRIISSPQTITLVGSHIDETPLPLNDISGDGVVDAHDETYVLAVDTITGDLCWEGHGGQPPQGLVLVDAAAGEVTVDPGLAAVGHDLRFYYVTLDQDLISIQIAPAAFLDWNVVDAAVNFGTPAQAEYATKQYYRTYDVTPNGAYTDLLFYPCNAGHTVTVDYKYDNGSTTVNGEMHTVNTEPGNHYITLNGPNVTEIIAVRGKSLQAIAWWRTPNGRLERLEINTVR